MPKQNRPVFIIGAGGIVTDAHLPAYKIAGFEVAGIYDMDVEKATSVAGKFGIPNTFANLEEMLLAAPEKVIFDLAVPGSAIAGILQQLPEWAAVLVQKPMGDNLAQAHQILQITRERKQVAAINFQLRYAPFINEARKLIDQGVIGEICGIDVQVNVFTPWHLWQFLYGLPRVEILYHSIHYIDLVRSFFGNPKGMFAKTTKHPAMKELASVRSNIIMDYGDWISANIITNHCHNFGTKHQDSFIKIEGTKGAIKMKLGLLMDYPAGVPDVFEYVILEEGKEPEWKNLAVDGRWFPHAFIGSMAQVMLAAEGSIAQPDNSVEDCIYTMACVEAAYESSAGGGISLSQ
ncbi:MAG: Gfo/Idh/MocA family oxidoreductase [Bacteroidota bacterium]